MVSVDAVVGKLGDRISVLRAEPAVKNALRMSKAPSMLNTGKPRLQWQSGILEAQRLMARFQPGKIKALRRALWYSQRQLAMVLGVTPVTIHRWETEQSAPDGNQIAQLIQLSREHRLYVDLFADGESEIIRIDDSESDLAEENKRLWRLLGVVARYLPPSEEIGESIVASSIEIRRGTKPASPKYPAKESPIHETNRAANMFNVVLADRMSREQYAILNNALGLTPTTPGSRSTKDRTGSQRSVPVNSLGLQNSSSSPNASTERAVAANENRLACWPCFLSDGKVSDR